MYDPAEVTVTGTSEATESGEYTFGLTPSKNHCWPDGSITIKEFAWSIEGANFSSIAPEELQQCIRDGSAPSRFVVGDTTSIAHKGTIQTLELDEVFSYAILGFNHNAAVEGDKTIHLMLFSNSDNISVALTDNLYGEKINYGELGFHLQPRHDPKYKSEASYSEFIDRYENGTNDGGWEAMYLRNTTLPEYLNTLPESWRKVLCPITKYSIKFDWGAPGSFNERGTYELSSSIDSVFIPSVCEMCGKSNSITLCEEEQNKQAQYSLFLNGFNIAKYSHQKIEEPVIYHLRSFPNYMYYRNVSIYSFKNGTADVDWSSYSSVAYSKGIVPIISIG